MTLKKEKEPRSRFVTTERAPNEPPTFTVALGSFLHRAFAKGYGAAHVRAHLMAGVVVGIVALPLSVAFAIAVGVPPQHGLYTAIIAGASVAVFSGGKVPR